MDRKMMEALEADGDKLRQLTGEDHGPRAVCAGITIDDICYRFLSAKDKADCAEVIATGSYGAGYYRGYADALGELIEVMTGDTAAALSSQQENTEAI